MTVQEIIETAMRHNNDLANGATMSAQDARIGLTAFTSMLMALPAIARRLERVRIDEAHTAEENTRIFNTTAGNLTITLPEEIEDADDPEADDEDNRPPRNGSLVGISGAAGQYGMYVYVEMLGAWKRLDSLALTDDNPLGPEHDEGLAYMLAVRLTIPPNSPPPIVLEGAAAGRRLIRQRFRQPYSPTVSLALLQTSAWREHGVGSTSN